MSKSRSFLLALATGAIVTSVVATAAAPPAAAQEVAAAHAPTAAGGVLRPGDVLRLEVWRMPELSGEFQISPAGTIVHPVLQDVVVTGVPLSQVVARLDSALSRESTNARFVVQPILRVSVGGEVAAPNLYRHPLGTTIAEAVVLAGGATTSGDLRRVRLVRDGREVALDLRDPAAAANRAPIASGDQIIVERRGRSFRESVTPIMTAIGTLASVAVLVFRVTRD